MDAKKASGVLRRTSYTEEEIPTADREDSGYKKTLCTKQKSPRGGNAEQRWTKKGTGGAEKKGGKMNASVTRSTRAKIGEKFSKINK